MRFLHLLFCLLVAAAGAQLSAQRIAVLCDVHITPGNASEPQLIAAVDEINNADFDLVIMNGDLTNEGSDAELVNVKQILDKISHPLVVLPGNHETTWSQSACKTFFDLWGNDRFVTQVDSLLVIGIACGPYMKMGDGHIKQEDLHWLNHTLDSLAVDGVRVLSVNHYPLTDDLDNYTDYINTLARYPVIAHINGHYHAWKQYLAGSIPCAMLRALDMKKGNYGYSIVEISPDWVHIYNKCIGSPAEPMFAFPCRKAPDGTASALPSAQPSDRRAPLYTDSASIFTRIAADDKNIYFGNSLGYAKAVDKVTGELRWAIPTGSSLFSRPTLLAGGRVAFPTATGLLIVNAADGKIIKEYPSAEGPYVADGILTDYGWVQGGYKRIELRDRKSGKLKWTYDSIFNYCQAAPALDGSDLVFGAWDCNLRCLDIRTGTLRWVWNNGRKNNMLGPGNVVPVITPDKVFIVAPDRYMTAIDRQTGATLWRDNSHRYREAMGCSEDRTRIYAKTMDGELVAVDATTPDFHELWRVDLTTGYDHAPCIVVEHNGIVYTGSRHGDVCAVDAATHTLLRCEHLGTSEVNGIDLDPTSNTLFVSLIEGTIFPLLP